MKKNQIEDTKMVILPRDANPIVKTVKETKAEGSKAVEAMNEAFKTYYQGLKIEKAQ